MQDMKISNIILVLLIVICSCKQNEEIITGPVSGKIGALDQYCLPVTPPEGISVSLIKDTTLIDITVTNPMGQYTFENVQYGKYSIRVERPGYVQSRYDNTVYHIGGKSPTLTDFFIFSVPDYQLTLDSLRKIDNYVIIFLKYNGDTLLPSNTCGMALRVFAGNTPDVSSQNFIACTLAYLSDIPINEQYHKFALHAQYPEWDMENSFEQLKNDIIYIRIYPIASGQGLRRDYYPEALGLASNVLSFRWEEIGSR
jgi:hypothetical protein